MSNDISCLKKCGRVKGPSRGLCHNCYLVVLKRVNAGETTWEKEVELGHAEARKPKNWNQFRTRK